MTISFDDFMKVDVRVGTIVEVKEFPEAKKPAFKLKVDFGDDIVSSCPSLRSRSFIRRISWLVNRFLRWSISLRNRSARLCQRFLGFQMRRTL